MSFHLDKFIPKNVITAKVILELRKAQTFRQLVNVHTPTQLGRGDSYRVPGVGDITVGTYAGTDISIQDLADINSDIAINQAKYYAFYLDMVDNAQAAQTILPLYSSRAAYKLADAADAFIATTMTSGATVVNATPQDVDDTNVADVILAIKTKMDEANVPLAGRYLVVPPFMDAAIAKANIMAIQASEQARGNGFITRFLGFDIYTSNNLVNGANVAPKPQARFVVAGIMDAFDFVDCLNEVIFMDSEKRFASLSKGLHVYGGKVTQAAAIYKQDVQPA